MKLTTVLVLIAVFLTGCSGEETVKERLFRLCKEAIAEKLVSPSSAEFASISEAVLMEDWEEFYGLHLLSTSVESKNAFGTMIKNDFDCSIIQSGTAAATAIEPLWKTIYERFDEEEQAKLEYIKVVEDVILETFGLLGSKPDVIVDPPQGEAAPNHRFYVVAQRSR